MDWNDASNIKVLAASLARCPHWATPGPARDSLRRGSREPCGGLTPDYPWDYDYPYGQFNVIGIRVVRR